MEANIQSEENVRDGSSFMTVIENLFGPSDQMSWCRFQRSELILELYNFIAGKSPGDTIP